MTVTFAGRVSRITPRRALRQCGKLAKDVRHGGKILRGTTKCGPARHTRPACGARASPSLQDGQKYIRDKRGHVAQCQQPTPTSNAWSFSSRCAGAGSATRQCSARWTKCRALSSSRPVLPRAATADCLRADHQSALRRRLYDRTAAVEPQHRVLEIGTGSDDRPSARARGGSIVSRRTLADAARERIVTIRPRRRHDRRAGFLPLPPHDGYRRRGDVAELAEGGKMVPVGPRPPN